MKLYLYVTDDEYELPLAIAESIKELSMTIGVHRNTIVKNLKRPSRYKRIEVEEDDE